MVEKNNFRHIIWNAYNIIDGTDALIPTIFLQNHQLLTTYMINILLFILTPKNGFVYNHLL